MTSPTTTKENIMQPTTLQEAINIIKFLQTTHKQEKGKLKEAFQKQVENIKLLEANRKRELEFLSAELQKYEQNLAIKTEMVRQQIDEKDRIIQEHEKTIEELNTKLKIRDDFTVPEITVLVDSNSDSGVAMENDDSGPKIEETKTELKTVRKCSRRFAESISFLRRVDFSPMKYKPCNREGTKKKEDKKKNLEVPSCNIRGFVRQLSNERPLSDDDKHNEDPVFSDGSIEPLTIRPKKINDSMNNHFSDDGSEDTSEEIFDRVMTRSSIRRSVKVNPKYKKINRTKSKLLEQVKVNIVD